MGGCSTPIMWPYFEGGRSGSPTAAAACLSPLTPTVNIGAVHNKRGCDPRRLTHMMLEAAPIADWYTAWV